jgi:gluconolactonase
LPRPDVGPVELLAGDLGKTEGPVWLGDDTVACTSIDHGRVYLIGPDGVAAVECPGGPNGLVLGGRGAYIARNGGLWGASPSVPAVLLVDGTGVHDIVTLPDDAGPNDLAFAPDGRLWFTDTGRDGDPFDPAVRAGRVWSCAPDGANLRVEIDDLVFSNGLAFAADGATLYITETASRRVLSLPWSHGEVGAASVLAELPAGMPDGFAVDALGRLWLPATSAHAVLVLSPDGQWLGQLPTGPGSRPTNCCFGGEDGTKLIVAASGSQALLTVDVGVTGAPLLTDAAVTGVVALRAAAHRLRPEEVR